MISFVAVPVCLGMYSFLLSILLLQSSHALLSVVSAFPASFLHVKGASCQANSKFLCGGTPAGNPLFVIKRKHDTGTANVSFHVIKTVLASTTLPFGTMKDEFGQRDDPTTAANRVKPSTAPRGRHSSSKKKSSIRKSSTSSSSSSSSNTTSSRSSTQRHYNGKKMESNEAIYFYRNDTDVMTFYFNENGNNSTKDRHITMVKFKVRGNPVPLARHRTYRGLMFNPSAKKQRQFCSVVLDMLPDFCFKQSSAGHDDEMRMKDMGNDLNDTCDDDDDMIMMSTKRRSIENVIPIFQNQVISVQIISRMKRPKRHFVANKPGPGRLREERSRIDDNGAVQNLASHLEVTRPDVDNLAKFVLDSLNGILYNDDRQVVSLHVMKMYDHEEPYSGATDVIIRSMTSEDFPVVFFIYSLQQG